MAAWLLETSSVMNYERLLGLYLSLEVLSLLAWQYAKRHRGAEAVLLVVSALLGTIAFPMALVSLYGFLLEMRQGKP